MHTIILNDLIIQINLSKQTENIKKQDAVQSKMMGIKRQTALQSMCSGMFSGHSAYLLSQTDKIHRETESTKQSKRKTRKQEF